jgi:hypothetical protein
MKNGSKSVIIKEVFKNIDIPDSAYETSENRYRDIGEWLQRDESAISSNKPHIFPQGSFRLGTVIRPLNGRDEYDLDTACELQEGISHLTHTQKELKILVGDEIEHYRISRGIDQSLEEKHRCWRLLYKDDMKFHIDILPCIPEQKLKRSILKDTLLERDFDEGLADIVAQLSVVITDDRHPHYEYIADDWNISNPEGYARWFMFRMKQAEKLLEERAIMAKVASIDELPTYKWMTPLQRSVQLLKRHRDIVFQDDPEGKPTSIIISTLAARAYSGDSDVTESIENILDNMEHYVNQKKPKIPNPVNPQEDFSDRWTSGEGRKNRLEEKFWDWLTQARNDFEILISSQNIRNIKEIAQSRYGVDIDETVLKGALGVQMTYYVQKPKQHNIANAPSPWLKI